MFSEPRRKRPESHNQHYLNSGGRLERAEHREILMWCRQEPPRDAFSCLVPVPADSDQVKLQRSRTFRISRKHSAVIVRPAQGRVFRRLW
jgi:hypothetical protein